MRRLQKDPNLHLQYIETLKDYENKNIIEKVRCPKEPVDKPVFYLPHQPVFREESATTKMRIVFDASSSHNFKHLSLNDCLCRKGQRCSSFFLWEENGKIQVYRFNRVLFGVTSSPFLLTATLKTHLRKHSEEFPTTTECLDRCLYVDDFISGADNVSDAFEISTQATSIMSQASMVLRKWTTNDNTLMQFWTREGFDTQPQVNTIKVLGLSWNPAEDCLILGKQSLVNSLSKNESTKRFLLRTIGRIFDPLGLLSPFTIRAKFILQVLWMKKISWDEEIPVDIQKIWLQWCSEVPDLSELRVPRNVLNLNIQVPTDILELHCFCDASQKAYGAAIYARVVKDNNIEVNLLVSKSRVTPLRKITLPRLELLGALLAARLASKVKKTVDLKKALLSVLLDGFKNNSLLD
ncbi:uncharacterized protein LOC118184500 [Stegodyphus dumicola]|uniref:uncharacterized protein LOC118184500 n=1 Tax=Stegodyphus dumicola TaxID=202533 RepID=UPI0015A8D1A6|nr:uncharacterized protein LOC118184500 [Stegodyphus dumicola]